MKGKIMSAVIGASLLAAGGSAGAAENPFGLVYANAVAENLNRRGIKTEFHAYPRLGHGFGLGTGTSAEGWIDLAIDFWQNNSL